MAQVEVAAANSSSAEPASDQYKIAVGIVVAMMEVTAARVVEAAGKAVADTSTSPPYSSLLVERHDRQQHSEH